MYRLGGLWQIGTFFRDEFTEPTWNVSETPDTGQNWIGGRFTIAEPLRDAVSGAALLARESQIEAGVAR